jgi:hypothetical protein
MEPNSLVKQIPYIVWKLMIHYHVHKGLPFVSVLSPINPIYTLPTDFFKTHRSIALSLCLGLSSGLSLWFHYQNPICTSYLLCMYHVPCLSSSQSDHLDYLARDTDHDPYVGVSFIPSFLIPLSTLFLKILSVCSSFNVRY